MRWNPPWSDIRVEFFINAAQTEASVEAYFADGRYIGTIDAKQNSYGPFPKNEWHVRGVGIEEEGTRRQGIGTRMYQALAENLRALGATRLCSDSQLTTESRGFWEKQVRKGRAREVRRYPLAENAEWYCYDFPPGPIDLSGTRRTGYSKK
jgi:hypothetical protein